MILCDGFAVTVNAAKTVFCANVGDLAKAYKEAVFEASEGDTIEVVWNGHIIETYVP